MFSNVTKVLYRKCFVELRRFFFYARRRVTRTESTLYFIIPPERLVFFGYFSLKYRTRIYGYLLMAGTRRTRSVRRDAKISDSGGGGEKKELFFHNTQCVP